VESSILGPGNRFFMANSMAREEIMREPMEDNEDLIQVDALVASLAPLE